MGREVRSEEEGRGGERTEGGGRRGKGERGEKGRRRGEGREEMGRKKEGRKGREEREESVALALLGDKRNPQTHKLTQGLSVFFLGPSQSSLFV